MRHMPGVAYIEHNIPRTGGHYPSPAYLRCFPQSQQPNGEAIENLHDIKACDANIKQVARTLNICRITLEASM